MQSTKTFTIESREYLGPTKAVAKSIDRRLSNDKTSRLAASSFSNSLAQLRPPDLDDSNNNSNGSSIVDKYSRKATITNINRQATENNYSSDIVSSARNDISNQPETRSNNLDSIADRDSYLVELVQEFQASLNRRECDRSNCHRFRVLSYRTVQTLLEHHKLLKESSAKKESQESSPKMDKNNLLELLSEKEKKIQDLERLVEDQRRLRLQDASQVEDKAAKIKEWVANKLKELENQNKQLRDQNRKQKQTVESLNNKLALLSPVSSPRRTPASLSLQPAILADQSPNLRREGENQAVKDNPCENDVKAKPQLRPASPVYDSVSLEQIQKSYAINNQAQLNLYDITSPETKPPPPPLHQSDKWELKLYSLADENFSSLLRNSEDGKWQDDSPLADQAEYNTEHEISVSRKSSSSQKNDLISLVKPSYTTIDGDHVIEDTLNKSNSDRQSIDRPRSSAPIADKDSCGSSTNRQSNGDGSSNNSSVAIIGRQRNGLANSDENIEKSTTLFGTPMRSRPSIGDNILRTQSVRRNPSPEKLFDFMIADLTKRGHLIKSGALKNHHRWFVLKNFYLYSYKSEADEASNSTPHTKLRLTTDCQVIQAPSAGDSHFPFKLIYQDKSLQFIAETAQTRDQWVRMLTISINMSDVEPESLTKVHSTFEGMMSFTRLGHTKKCHAILVNRLLFFLRSITDPTPLSYLCLKESRIREVTDNHDYDIDEQELLKYTCQKAQDCSLAIYPKYAMTSDPVYITLGNQQDTDKWFHHLSIASGIDQMYGTPFEQALASIMIRNSISQGKLSRNNPITNFSGRISSCCLWNGNNLMVYSDKPISQPLTSLPNETLRMEAIELSKSILLFAQVPLEPVAIDYHVSLLQNCISRFLKYPELRNEFYAQLIKQCTYIVHRADQDFGDGFLTNVDRSSFDSSSTSSIDCHILTDVDLLDAMQREVRLDPPKTLSHSTTTSQIKHSKCLNSDTSNACSQQAPPSKSELVQVMQMLSVVVSLNLPRGRMRWWLTDFLKKFADPATQIGKYALYTLKAIERTTAKGTRENVPSRTEIMSIMLRNPHDHSNPHSLPVSFSDGSYLVLEADGSTTVEEFMSSMHRQINVRESLESDFYLFADDPTGSKELHILEPQRKVLDIVGWWEQALRRHNSGRYQTTRVIKLICKKRLVLRTEQGETPHERLLIVHQINQEIACQKIPVNGNFAVELAAIMAQLIFGDLDKSKDDGVVSDRLEKLSNIFLCKSTRIGTQEDANIKLINCWRSLAGRSAQDCVRVYLNCIRRLAFASGINTINS